VAAPTVAASPEALIAPGVPSAVGYSSAVAHICAGALRFDHPHQMGTRADALAVARDIRLSTARRLARVAALTPPPRLHRISRRWVASERALAAMFARTWVQIYDAIDAAHSLSQSAGLVGRLQRLVHAPDRLKLAAARLELVHHVPDCTGC
jgi:hypothetical protein